MTTNYLNNLNNSIKINSATISNAESKDALVALSKRNSGDLNRVADYINALIVPAVASLASKPRYPFDTIESGISGLTIVTYPEAQGNNKFNTELYWMKGPTEETGRPCTVKESFDYLLANMIDRVVEIRESVTDLNPIMDQLVCSNRDLIRLAVDTFGIKYSGSFNCDSSGTKTYSIGEHIYQIINQLTGSSVADELDTNSSNYPTLSIPGVEIATETTKGISEIATVKEIAQASGLNDSDSVAELAVTADRLLGALSSDDANGSLVSGEVNSLREASKTIADERIAASDIDALANVNNNTPVTGDALVYNGNSWGPGSINSTTLLGDRVTLPTVGDLSNNLAMDNGITIAYDHYSEANVKATSYNLHGFNFNYYRSEDEEWSKDVGVTINQTLLSKHVPFVFKSSPTPGIFNETRMQVVNTGLLNLGNPINLLSPSLNKPREIGFYQNTCSTWDLTNQSHTIKPEKIIGVCRSDFQYGKEFASQSSGSLTGSVTTEFQTFMTSNLDGNIIECIQESGSSKVMVLGPYRVGDRIYLCPGKILDLAGIPNNLGIAISETFMNESIENLSLGVVQVSNSIFNILTREPVDTCVTVGTSLHIESKALGVITNKYNSSNNPQTDPINTLCYSLVESTYDSTGGNPLRLLINQEILEILPGANLLSAEYTDLSRRYTELSLPLVKLTI